MKLMMLMPDLALIGAQKMGLNLLENLDNDIVSDTELVILSDKLNNLDNIQSIPNFQVIKRFFTGYLSKFDTIFSIYRLRKIIKKSNPDVIISIAPIMNIYLLLSLSFFGSKKPKIIIEEHQHLTQSLSGDNSSHHWTMKFFYKFCLSIYNTADIVKVVSEDSKNDFITNWNIPKDKLVVVNPPINIENITKLSLEDIPQSVKSFIKKEDNIIFSLGRLESQKNFHLLIEAFYQSYLKDSSLKLIIIGSGSQMESLNNKIVTLGIKDRVLLAGFIENPYPVFKIAKLFCLTSIWEGMPVTIMESMLLGCPVISVDCKSGPSEMIINNKNGLLVKNNSESISYAINYLIDDTILLNEISSNGIEYAKKWDILSYTQQVTQHIKDLLK